MVNKTTTFATPVFSQSLSEYSAFVTKVDEILKGINTSMPVKVLAVRGGGVAPVGYIDCEILVQQLTGKNEPVDNVTCFNLPYLRIQGGKNAVICDPQVGDIGVATFAQRDCTGVNNIRGKAPPRSFRFLSCSDGYYHGGFLNGAPIRYLELNDSGIVIHAPDKITIEAPDVEINATSFKVNAAQTEIISGSNVITGPIQVTGGMTGGAGMTMTGDITADGISLVSHIHGGVQSGGSKTSTPE